MDKASVGGVLVGVGGITAGLLIEGGNLGQIIQPTAGMIVFGGTFGAVLLQFPLPVVLTAFRRLIHVFLEPKLQPHQLVTQLVGYANKARKDGIVSLDAETANISEPFLARCHRHRRFQERIGIGVAHDGHRGAGSERC